VIADSTVSFQLGPVVVVSVATVVRTVVSSVVGSNAFLDASDVVVDDSAEEIVVPTVGETFLPLFVASDESGMVSAFAVVDGAVTSGTDSVVK